MSYLTLTPLDINRENNTSILVAKVTMILSRRAAATNFSSLDPVSVFLSVTTSSIQNISYFIHSFEHYTVGQTEEKVVWVFSALSLKNEDVSNSNIFRLTIVSVQGSRHAGRQNSFKMTIVLSETLSFAQPFIHFLANQVSNQVMNPLGTFATSQVSLLV